MVSGGRGQVLPTDYHEPYGWWGWHWSPPVPLSIVQLLKLKSLDARLAALLWLFLQHRASLVVAADPPLAGKTTTLTALLGFLPPGTQRVYTRGMGETFDFLQATVPQRTYILVNEISDHIPIYLWGLPVLTLFQALEGGYAFGATMHADTPEAVVKILGEELGIPGSLLARLNLIINLQVVRDNWELRRRVGRVSLLRPAPGTASGFTVVPIASGDLGSDELIHHDAPLLREALTECLGMSPGELAQEISRRAEYLTELLARGVRSIPAVREAVARYYRERRP